MASRLRVLSLFSGIGGFELGFEATGRFVTVAQSEIDPYACQVLEKHWDVPNLGSVTDIKEGDLDGIGPVDVVLGGFPCQDISCAGRGDGIEGGRSGLFFDLMRVVRMVRPRYVVLENVPMLLTGDSGRWMSAVLGELAESGYDAKWDCVPAAAVGAPHRRDRVFIVAYANRERLEEWSQQDGNPKAGKQASRRDNARRRGQDVAYTERQGLEGHGAKPRQPEISQPRDSGAWPRSTDEWQTEPDVGRVADGVPNRVDRLRALGNAVVPQVAAIVAGWVLAIEDGA